MNQDQETKDTSDTHEPNQSRYHHTSLVLLVILGAIVLAAIIYAGYYAWQNRGLQ